MLNPQEMETALDLFKDLAKITLFLIGGIIFIYCNSLARKIRKANPNEYERLRKKQNPTDEELYNLFEEEE